MGNQIIHKSLYNIIDTSEMKEFLSNLNILDGFYMDTNLSISSKCLVIINTLINHLSLSSTNCDELYNYQCCDLFPGVSIQFDRESFDKIEKFKRNCQLIRHLSIFNSNLNTVEEFIELHNFLRLLSLHLENLPIKFVQHLKIHRLTLLKLCVHNCISDLKSLIELCGGDHSFSGNWNNLRHLDVRYNKLREIDNSVRLLNNLTVLDASRNDICSIEFIDKLPTLECLNVSYNHVKRLPKISNHGLKVLIIGYNYLNNLAEIKNFKRMKTLNASYNMIASHHHLLELNELDVLEELILRGNPICTSDQYRLSVLRVVSTRVMINFTLDAQIFSKKERNILKKIPIIVIGPPPNVNTNFTTHVPIIKTNRRDVDNINSNIAGLEISPSSFIGRQRFPVVFNDNGSGDYIDNPAKQNFRPAEKLIGSIVESDTDGTFATTDEQSSDLLSSKNLKPYFIGKQTSNLIRSSSQSRSSLMNVSLQIIEHKFMAVNENFLIVDNINLWTLLFAYRDSEQNRILKLVFYDEVNSKVSGNLEFQNKLLEFGTSNELQDFFEHLYIYLEGFTISFDNTKHFSITTGNIVCIRCKSNYQFVSKTFRPIICNECKNFEFIFVSIEATPKKPEVDRKAEIITPHLPQSAPFESKSPVVKSHLKPATSAYVIKAISSENLHAIERDNLEDSNDTSYHTALDKSTTQLSSVCDLTNYSGSQDNLGMDEDNINLSVSGTLNLDIPVDHYTNTLILQNSKDIIPRNPEENYSLMYLNEFVRSNWVVHHPLSNVSVNMNNITKIDDRVKLYFLTTVMRDHEDLQAVFKSHIIYKAPSSVSIEALVVLSNLRILVYSWIDKDSASLEDCLKLIIEFKLKQLVQIDDCLNHQWIEMKFKNKSPLYLLIGDIRSNKTVMLSLTELGSSNVSKLSVRTLREIDKFKSDQITLDMVKAMNDESNIEALNDCQYFLIGSCSCMSATESTDSEYSPKMIGIQNEHLFFIYIKFEMKPHQVKFELHRSFSFYILNDIIIVDNANNYRCRLKFFQDNVTNTIDIEFLSPAARSQALVCIGNNWKQLFQSNLNFEIFPIDDDHN